MQAIIYMDIDKFFFWNIRNIHESNNNMSELYFRFNYWQRKVSSPQAEPVEHFTPTNRPTDRLTKLYQFYFYDVMKYVRTNHMAYTH